MRGEDRKCLSMSMNVEAVRKDSKFCKRSMRTIAIFGVPSVKPKGHRGFYPFLAQALLNLLLCVQPDPPERSIRRWDTFKDLIYATKGLLPDIGTPSRCFIS